MAAFDPLDLTALRASAAGFGFVQRADLLRLLEEVEVGRGRIAELEAENALLNQGFESAMDLQAELQQKVRALEAGQP